MTGAGKGADRQTHPMIRALSLSQEATIAATRAVQTPHLNEDNGS